MNISNELSKIKEEFFISIILILIPVIFLTDLRLSIQALY